MEAIVLQTFICAACGWQLGALAEVNCPRCQKVMQAVPGTRRKKLCGRGRRGRRGKPEEGCRVTESSARGACKPRKIFLPGKAARFPGRESLLSENRNPNLGPIGAGDPLIR
jgi:hypothetical protein